MQSQKTVRALKANVNEERALRMFRGGTLSRMMRGPLRRVALVYAPFRLFHVKVQSSAGNQQYFIAVDAVSGTLDPYSFDAPPSPQSMEQQRTCNHFAARPTEDSKNAAVDRVRRIIFSQGIFKTGKYEIMAEHLAQSDFFLPYWVAFYAEDDSAHAQIRVLDAVRATHEGAKARRVIEQAIAAL